MWYFVIKNLFTQLAVEEALVITRSPTRRRAVGQHSNHGENDRQTTNKCPLKLLVQ